MRNPPARSVVSGFGTVCCLIFLAAFWPASDPLRRRVPAFDAGETTLGECVDRMSAETKLPIFIDWRHLRSAPDTRLRWRSNGTSLASQLHKLFAIDDAVTGADANTVGPLIFVSTADMTAAFNERIRSHRLSDPAVPDRQPNLPEFWTNDLGQPIINLDPNGRPDVSATDCFGEQLPEVRFDHNDLADVVDYLRDVTGANIYVDWPGLAGVDVFRNSQVTLKLDKVRFSTLLSLILIEQSKTDVTSLDYSWDGEVITISTKANIAVETQRK